MRAGTYAAPIDGGDAMMLHFESQTAAFHTLKLAVLDTARRGRPVNLAEIAEVAPRYLGITARLTQRAERRERRWHWVDDPGFDLTEHLDERTVDGTAGLDLLCGELAGAHLDQSRPLWTLTLVHGLPEGRQAVVARIHHAIMDGSAAMNAFTALTSPTEGTAPEPMERTLPPIEAREPLPRRLAAIAALTVDGWRRTREYGPDESVPRRILPRTRINPRSNRPGRVCASGSVPLDEVTELARLLGVGTMGALHGVLAQGLRDYLLAHGEAPAHPLVANFGVVEDVNDPRCEGTRLATARVWMPVEMTDPLALVRRTARSCTESVALRRHRGFELQLRAAEFARIVPVLRNRFVNVPTYTPVHLQTAYVVGPAAARWFGDVEAVGWTSFAVSVAPADLSITAYTYAGRVWLGVVVTPGAMPDPGLYLHLTKDALRLLLELARTA